MDEKLRIWADRLSWNNTRGDILKDILCAKYTSKETDYLLDSINCYTTYIGSGLDGISIFPWYSNNKQREIPPHCIAVAIPCNHTDYIFAVHLGTLKAQFVGDNAVPEQVKDSIENVLSIMRRIKTEKRSSDE